MMRLICAIALLVATACTETPSAKADRAYDLADAAQTNARNGLARITDAESQISDLETEKQALEAKVSELESEIQSVRSDLAEYKDESVQWHHKHNY